MKETLYTSWAGKERFLQGKAFEACTETIRAHMLEFEVSPHYVLHQEGNMRIISANNDASFL